MGRTSPQRRGDKWPFLSQQFPTFGMSEYSYEPGTHVIASNEPKQPKETIGFRLNHLMLRIRVCPTLDDR